MEKGAVRKCVFHTDCRDDTEDEDIIYFGDSSMPVVDGRGGQQCVLQCQDPNEFGVVDTLLCTGECDGLYMYYGDGSTPR